jgi:streptogramin lyase
MRYLRTTFFVGAVLLGAAGSTAGQVLVREFNAAVGRVPLRIVLGSDAALWITESGEDRIGRITRAEAIAEFGVPNRCQPLFGVESSGARREP